MPWPFNKLSLVPARHWRRVRLQRDVPAEGQGLCLAGLSDLWCEPILPERAFRDAPASMPRVVLSHNPDSAEELGRDWRVELMLSGHTHGGQVYVPGMGTPLAPSSYGQKYAGGLCQGPAGPVVVSRGVGMTVLPVRLGAPPKIVEITLARA